MAKDKWIQSANLNKGVFSHKADTENMGTMAYASKVLKAHSRASTKTKKQAVLAQTFAKMRAKKGQ